MRGIFQYRPAPWTQPREAEWRVLPIPQLAYSPCQNPQNSRLLRSQALHCNAFLQPSPLISLISLEIVSKRMMVRIILVNPVLKVIQK